MVRPDPEPDFENLAAEPGGGPGSHPCRLLAAERKICQARKDLLAVETHRTSPPRRRIIQICAVHNPHRHPG